MKFFCKLFAATLFILTTKGMDTENRRKSAHKRKWIITINKIKNKNNKTSNQNVTPIQNSTSSDSSIPEWVKTQFTEQAKEFLKNYHFSATVSHKKTKKDTKIKKLDTLQKLAQKLAHLANEEQQLKELYKMLNFD